MRTFPLSLAHVARWTRGYLGVAATEWLLVVSVFALMPTLAAADELLWKFSTGQSLKYEVTQNVDSKILGTKVIGSTLEQKLDLTWEVDADDATKLKQTITRARLKMDSPVLSFNYDSGSNQEAEGPAAKSLQQVFKALVGKKIGMKMNAQGDIQDVRLEEISDALKSNLAAAEGNPLASEESIKQLITRSSISFPTGSITIGQEWKSPKIELKQPFGTQVLEVSNTYDGPVQRDGKELAKISRKITMTIKPAQGALLDVKIKSSEATAEIYFDAKEGKLVESTTSLNAVMEVVAANNTMEQEIKSTAVMKLVP